MNKIKVKKFPRGIDKCVKNAEIKVIKTRAHGKDFYNFEISADGTKPFILDSDYFVKAGAYPAEFVDMWSGGQWGNGKFAGCDFDINVMDKAEFGGPDDGAGLFASMYGCHLEDGEPHVNMDDGIDYVPVTCWFEGKNGKRTEFKCDDQENFLELFGEWDGKAKLPKAKEKEMKVTCELTFKASLVTKATTEKEAKEEAIKALAEAYRARGIDGIIAVVPTKVELTKKL